LKKAEDALASSVGDSVNKMNKWGGIYPTPKVWAVHAAVIPRYIKTLLQFI